MDYNLLYRYWNLVVPDSDKDHKIREFKKNINFNNKYHDLTILKAIERNNLGYIKFRNDEGYSWQCYKSLIMDLCIYFKRYEILNYLIETKQTNSNINESIAKLSKDESWKKIINRKDKKDNSLASWYHNMTCISEEEIYFFKKKLNII